MEFQESVAGMVTIEVLLVEDNRADAVLFKRALHESSLSHRLSIVPDGVEAMRYVRREPPYTNAKTPHLVLLDLNLPRKGGLEVLAEMKADPALKIIPIIVLSSSGSPEDIVKSYALGANTYLRKAVSLDDTSHLFKTMQHFWMNLAVLPTGLESS